MPDEDGNSRPNSTSTYEYSHEPFETFQNKVLLLARSLGGSNDVEVRYNRGGSYSRVVFARIMRDGAASTGIFRIPCFSDVTSSNESDSADGDDDDDKENQRSHQVRICAAMHVFFALHIYVPTAEKYSCMKRFYKL